ncbi:seven-hairpin glycosidase [Mycena galericulata]|nr:seven-hairpin glycosidase [Mycena galericulata]
MNLTNLFDQTVKISSEIDFSTSSSHAPVSVFETTIRYVGGLLSAYELGGAKSPVLIQKAQAVADKLARGQQNNTLPFNSMNFTTNNPIDETTNIAGAGTLSLEWAALTKYTNNATYGDLASKAVLHIASLPAPLPGLAAQNIDPTSGNFTDAYITWGAGSDSYFEYLLKYARYTNTDNKIFLNTWKTAVDSSIQNLLRTSTVGNYSYLADVDNAGNICHVGSHLACFHAGNWLLGGKLLQNQTITYIYGAQNTYASTATGIGPETFAFVSSDGDFSGGNLISTAQQAFYNKHGFYITGNVYIQRPEVLESNFYAWRITGDTKYLDRAAATIESFNKFLRIPGFKHKGIPDEFAGLQDVDIADPSLDNKYDETESFWFAEVLKYLYLTFDNPARISLDDYVFNTECHPLKAPPALDSY